MEWHFTFWDVTVSFVILNNHISVLHLRECKYTSAKDVQVFTHRFSETVVLSFVKNDFIIVYVIAARESGLEQSFNRTMSVFFADPKNLRCLFDWKDLNYWYYFSSFFKQKNEWMVPKSFGRLLSSAKRLCYRLRHFRRSTQLTEIRMILNEMYN